MYCDSCDPYCCFIEQHRSHALEDTTNKNLLTCKIAIVHAEFVQLCDLQNFQAFRTHTSYTIASFDYGESGTCCSDGVLVLGVRVLTRGPGVIKFVPLEGEPDSWYGSRDIKPDWFCIALLCPLVTPILAYWSLTAGWCEPGQPADK